MAEEIKISILTINADTNIPNFKQLIYNPTMTLSKSASDKQIIYFPKTVEITLKDLGGRQTGKHDKIKTFLSLNRLNQIIQNKKDKVAELEIDEKFKETNIKLLLDLLFSDDENFYLRGAPYVILSYDTILGDLSKPREILYKVEKSNNSKQRVVINRQSIRDKITQRNLYNITVNLLLQKGEKVTGTDKGCRKQKKVIDQLLREFQTRSSKTLVPLPKPRSIRRKYLLPPGFLSVNDWRKIVDMNYAADLIKQGKKPAAGERILLGITNG